MTIASHQGGVPRSSVAAALVLTVGSLASAFAYADASPCHRAARYVGPPLRPAPAADVFPKYAPEQPMAVMVSARLENVLDAAQPAFAPPAITAAVIRESGATWSATRAALGTPPPMFYWASAGKAWTAIAVLQLVEEGKLSLADRLARWAPDFPNAQLITVDQLLHHTSGLYSFQEDAALRARSGFKSRDELLSVAHAHAPLFCPGVAWSYSNTGYVLLGVIIERVDGRPLQQALTARIVDRLRLRETRVLGPNVPLTDIASPTSDPMLANGTGDDIRTPGAAGPIAASASDMARFWAAALSGTLTSPRSARAQYATLYPMFDNTGTSYGRGVMLYDVPASKNTPADVWLGHSGGLPGAKAVVAWSTRARAVVAVALTGDGPAEAVANRLLATLE